LKAFCAALLRQVSQGIAARLESPLAPAAASDQQPSVH
jgi:protease I